MKIKLAYFLLFFLLTNCISFSQVKKGYNSSNFSESVDLFNGNGTLGNIYNNTACGLNIATASRKITKRDDANKINDVNGGGFPSTLNISTLPACYIIEKAYLYWTVSYKSGSSTTPVVVLTNPNGIQANYPANLIGTAGAKCWGEQGTRAFRADVSAAITGNGNYILNDILGNPVWEVDGATLIIIYRDMYATYTGTLVIDDGIFTGVNIPVAYSITGINVCGPTNNASAMMIASDFQDVVSTDVEITLNGVNYTVPKKFWNYYNQNTTINVGQTTSSFGVPNQSVPQGPYLECYAVEMVGVYFQTGCLSCTPPTPLLVVASGTNPSCNDNDGIASVVSSSGGTPPYSYSWNGTGQTGITATGLGGGTYTVTITDASLCDSNTAIITLVSPTTFNQTTSFIAPTCNSSTDGSAIVNVSGGTPPFTYSWSNGSTNNAISNIPAGVYYINISDNAGCLKSDSVIVTEPEKLNSNISVINATCQNNNGIASVNVTGGIGAYSYSWNNGLTTQSITAISEGLYTVSVFDQNGCAHFDTAIITGSNPPKVVLTPNSPSCNGFADGVINSVITDGTPPFVFLWSDGQTAASAIGLIAGNYTLQVVDAYQCKDTAFATLVDPDPIQLSLIATNASCSNNDGSVSVVASGGTGNFQFQWSNGVTNSSASSLTAGNYSVVVTDDKGCSKADSMVVTQPSPIVLSTNVNNITCFGLSNGEGSVTVVSGNSPYMYLWNNGSTTSSISALAPGTYTVTVNDLLNCIDSVFIVITEPPALNINLSSVGTICNAGTGIINAIVNGGVSPYTYSWSNGQTQNSATGLLAGSYSVTVTDNSGCTNSNAATVTSPNSGTLSLTKTDVSCNGGNDGIINSVVSGGSSPYLYSWSNGLTTQNATSLVAGSYTITVTDNNQCVMSQAAVVSEPPLLGLSTSNDLDVCSGKSVLLNATAFGGSPSYSYNWIEAGSSSSSITVFPSSSGYYHVNATDNNGCLASDSIHINVLSSPQLLFTVNDTAGCVPLCVSFKDLTSAATGDPLAVWSWNFGDGGGSIEQHPSYCYKTPGDYDVSLSVTSANGCTANFTEQDYIHVYPYPVADFTPSPEVASYLDPHFTFTDASSGAASWMWNFGDNGLWTSSTGSTEYTYNVDNSGVIKFDVTLVVTNEYGCADTIVKPIEIEPEWTFYVPNTFTPNGDNHNDYFSGSGIGIKDYEMWIYDRWGNEIYHCTDIKDPWDGKVQNGASGEVAQIDTYVWIIKISDIFDKKHRYIGHVNIVN